MKLVLAEPRLLKESIGIISELVNEITLRIDKDKIEVVAIDPANIVLIDFKLLSSAFIEFDITEQKKIHISLESFNAVLKRAKPSDTVTLTLDEERNRLKIGLKGETNRMFNIALLDLSEEQQKIPALKFLAKITTLSTRFSDAVEDMGIVDESVALQLENDRFVIQSQGQFNDAKVEFPIGEETSILMDSKEPVSSKYSIEYLRKIAKAARISDLVDIHLGNDYPLKAEYRLLDKLKLSFVLAPRVSND